MAHVCLLLVERRGGRWRQLLGILSRVDVRFRDEAAAEQLHFLRGLEPPCGPEDSDGSIQTTVCEMARDDLLVARSHDDLISLLNGTSDATDMGVQFEVGADGNVTDRCESASAAPGGARAP